MNLENEKYKLRLAKINDLETVVSLYKSSIGTEGCTWNEFYPTHEDAKRDIENNCLFVYESESGIIGSASVVYENELDESGFFKTENEKAKEIARIVIKKEERGKRLSEKMLSDLFDILKKDGVSYIRLLVAISNKAAIKIYSSLGFEFIGECSMYSNDFFVAEKTL